MILKFGAEVCGGGQEHNTRSDLSDALSTRSNPDCFAKKPLFRSILPDSGDSLILNEIAVARHAPQPGRAVRQPDNSHRGFQRYLQEPEVIGQVVGMAMRLGEWHSVRESSQNHRVYSSTDKNTLA